MKKKFKTWIGVLLVVVLMNCLLAGCGNSADADSTTETETLSVGVESTEGALAEENNAEETGECPEGYVYDYQVSMEPIPEEIAALGGPCQGTIHAFPSRIAMALTELQMEEDPVLKAEVEKRIPEIEAALEEEIGGDFVVDGVILLDDLTWVFFCTEVATGYQFDLYYANQEYDAQLNDGLSISNVVKVTDYYNQGIESVGLQEKICPLATEVYSEGDVNVHSLLYVDMIDITIVQYTEDEVDKCLEQEKLLMLWENLQEYDNTLNYDVTVVFCLPEYQDVVEQKFNTGIRYDFYKIGSVDVVMKLIENNEIEACFAYSSRREREDENNLDILLEQYQTGTYDSTVVWDYWVE